MAWPTEVDNLDADISPSPTTKTLAELDHSGRHNRPAQALRALRTKLGALGSVPDDLFDQVPDDSLLVKQGGQWQEVPSGTFESVLGQPGTPAANRQTLQDFYDAAASELSAEGLLPAGTVWEIDQPITVTRDALSHPKGWINLRGYGVIIRPSAGFTGDRLFTLDVVGSDEDYITWEGITFDGLDHTVNGVDFYKTTIAYDLASADHPTTDNEYVKAVKLINCIVARCYRGVRYIGNNLRCPGTVFRDNRCGAFAASTGNDVSVVDAAFRRNYVGVELLQSESSAPVSWTFTGTIFESNANCAIHNRGGGDIVAIGGHWENNGWDLTKTAYDSGNSVPPEACNIWQRTSPNFTFANRVIVIGGRRNAITYDLILEHAHEFTYIGPPTPVKLDGSIRRCTFMGGIGADDITVTANAVLSTGSGSVTWLEIDGLRYEIINGALVPQQDRLRRAVGRLNDVVAHDTFTRPDASSLGVSESGHTWNDPSSVWTIVGNTAQATDVPRHPAWVDAGVGDGRVRCTAVRGSDRDVGLIFRVKDADNLLRATWASHGGGRYLRIDKVEAGTATTLAETTSVSDYDDVHAVEMEAIVKHGFIWFRLLDLEVRHVLSSTDLTTFPQTVTTWGLSGPGGGVGTADSFEWDDFVVWGR